MNLANLKLLKAQHVKEGLIIYLIMKSQYVDTHSFIHKIS